jgi:hypothetical protein
VASGEDTAARFRRILAPSSEKIAQTRGAGRKCREGLYRRRVLLNNVRCLILRTAAEFSRKAERSMKGYPIGCIAKAHGI